MAKANPIEEAKELQQMLVSYAKQETIEPLKTLGGYLAWGLPGSLFMFLGVMFVSFGALRFLQSNVDDFEGGSYGSLFPYLGALGVLILMIALLFLAYTRAKKALS